MDTRVRLRAHGKPHTCIFTKIRKPPTCIFTANKTKGHHFCKRCGSSGHDRYLWYKKFEKFEEIIKLFNYFKNVSEQACERSEQASERTVRKGYLIILKM